MHLLCGAGYSAIIMSVIFSTVANLMHRWIIHDIHNILLTQNFAWTTYLRILNFLNAVSYTVYKIVTDTYNKCSGIYKIKSTKIQCIKWFYKLHWRETRDCSYNKLQLYALSTSTHYFLAPEGYSMERTANTAINAFNMIDQYVPI